MIIIVIIIAMNDGGWLVADREMKIWCFNEQFFTNISNPDGDFTAPGDVIEVNSKDLTTVMQFAQIRDMVS